MPSADQILNGLGEIANSWKAISLLWHVYFGAIALTLAFGVRPPRRMTALLLGLPFLSVAAAGWASRNPVDALVYAGVGIALLVVAAKLPRDDVRIAHGWPLMAGALLFAFGWIYPHFLETSSYLPYLYLAPIGIIPCATLILVIGSILVLEGLESRALGIILGAVGLLYGIMGVAYLHVVLDWALILGAAMILVHAFARKWASSPKELVAGA